MFKWFLNELISFNWNISRFIGILWRFIVMVEQMRQKSWLHHLQIHCQFWNSKIFSFEVWNELTRYNWNIFDENGEVDHINGTDRMFDVSNWMRIIFEKASNELVSVDSVAMPQDSIEIFDDSLKIQLKMVNSTTSTELTFRIECGSNVWKVGFFFFCSLVE